MIYNGNNPSLGYFPNPVDGGITYEEWCLTYGKYRWYHENGDPRTTYTIAYQWKPLFDKACKDADIAFSYRDIYDIEAFTSQFLAYVPTAWMLYKTSLELMSGTLDGTNIDPLVFEAGYDRETISSLTQHADTTSNSNANTNTENKARQINYEQGVQAYDNAINNDNIGLLGNDYANNMGDGVNIANSNDSVNAGSNTNATNSFKENVSEKRINYYDNLAFLRDRADRFKLIKPFYEYFDNLFTNVTSYNGWW